MFLEILRYFVPTDFTKRFQLKFASTLFFDPPTDFLCADYFFLFAGVILDSSVCRRYLLIVRLLFDFLIWLLLLINFFIPLLLSFNLWLLFLLLFFLCDLFCIFHLFFTIFSIFLRFLFFNLIGVVLVCNFLVIFGY